MSTLVAPFITRETVEMDTPASSATAWIPRLRFKGFGALPLSRGAVAFVPKRVRLHLYRTTLNEDDGWLGRGVHFYEVLVRPKRDLSVRDRRIEHACERAERCGPHKNIWSAKDAHRLRWTQLDEALPLPLDLNDAMTTVLLKVSEIEQLDRQLMRIRVLLQGATTF
jgi:hypothetical protein